MQPNGSSDVGSCLSTLLIQTHFRQTGFYLFIHDFKKKITVSIKAPHTNSLENKYPEQVYQNYVLKSGALG